MQVGDPFTEKVLIECCLELFAADLVVGIQDLGGAGLSCATSELASAGDGGMHVELDPVPLRDPTLAPEEILMSESQERMCAVVEPGQRRRVPGGLRASGTCWPPSSARSPTPTGCAIDWHGETVVDVPPRTVAHEGPVYERPIAAARPTRTRCRPTTPTTLPRPRDRRRAARDAAAAGRRRPNLCDKSWVTDQYDRYVRGNTVLAQPDDAGMIRVDEATGRGIALSTDGNGRYTRLDPYAGAQLALAEAYRNVATTGATPARGHQLPELRLARGPGGDVAVRRGRPRPGRRLPRARHPGHRRQRQLLQPDRRRRRSCPTPVVGVLGVIDDVAPAHRRSGFARRRRR